MQHSESPSSDTDDGSGPLDAIGKTTRRLVEQRAHTAVGFCALAVLQVGSLTRLILSYDPDRAIELVHQAVGITPVGKKKRSLTDPRDWFSLTQDQVARILVATDIPIVPIDWNIVREKGVPSRFTFEETYAIIAGEIGLLLNELHLLGIYPPLVRRPLVGHAEKLAKVARRFRDMLQHGDTERLLSDWPELRALCSRATELHMLASITVEAQQTEAKRRRRGRIQSPREIFIRDHLARCFELLYGRKAGVSRPNGTGEAGGPFIRFAVTFFAEIGLPLAAETIARDLRRRRQRGNGIATCTPAL